ncbi:hypothetical protein F5Y19DRAFT_122577 [Xylariaceae sp. FL1651]|nr:hypothetical protein F5Y19DRAFT_122577 [Xylariaceae sp. FL1651]
MSKPSETSDSYFPMNAERPGTVSPVSFEEGAVRPTPVRTGSSSLTGSNPVSPLDCEYTKPTEDLDVAQQLAKQPTYWSAKGWIQRSVSSSAGPKVEDPETRARKFQEAKKDLLASVGRL